VNPNIRASVAISAWNAVGAGDHPHAVFNWWRALEQHPQRRNFPTRTGVRITSATSQLSEAKIFVDETPGLTPTDLRAGRAA